jgi:hypothetical protein
MAKVIKPLPIWLCQECMADKSQGILQMQNIRPDATDFKIGLSEAIELLEYIQESETLADNTNNKVNRLVNAWHKLLRGNDEQL